MYLDRIIREMMGDSTEFERHTVLLPVDVAGQCRDLAYQMGVPMPRLIAELVTRAVPEADAEWRRINLLGDGDHGSTVPDLHWDQAARKESGGNG